ncbi:MAG: MraY family glycosyltransferase [Planctomycetota bacterium]
MLLISLLVAFLVSILFVPAMRRFAIKVGLVDHPDRDRKLHQRPVAVAGGVAVYFAVLTSFLVIEWFDQNLTGSTLLGGGSRRWMVFFGASAAIMVVGLIDDVWSLRGRQKLLFQVFIAMIIVGAGTRAPGIELLGFRVELGALAIPVSVLYLLVCINALNLIDGADGMATTVGGLICGSIGLLVYFSYGITAEAVAAICLCGALGGFLVFNRPPATIFLGDAGSMMVGLMVGMLSMWCSLKESTVISAAPIAILVLPLFDSSAAIVRRWLTGRSLYTTDRGHLHHLLHERFGPSMMLWVVASLCMMSSLIAILAVQLDQEWLAPTGAALVLVGLIVTRSFGYAECRLLAGKCRNLVKSFMMRADQCDSETLSQHIQTQGDGCWDVVWEPLVAFAKVNGFASVRMDANLSWLQEGYHATWQSVRLPDKAFQSRVRIPLFVQRRGEEELVPIGQVDVIANANETMHERLSDFLTHASELQTQVQELIDRMEHRLEPSATDARPLIVADTSPDSADVAEVSVTS